MAAPATSAPQAHYISAICALWIIITDLALFRVTLRDMSIHGTDSPKSPLFLDSALHDRFRLAHVRLERFHEVARHLRSCTAE